MTSDPKTPKPGRDGGSEPVDAPEAPVSGFEEERAAYVAEHPEESETASGDEAKRLEGDIAELQSKAAERDEYLALAQRAQADFENYRKRAARDVAAAEGRGTAKLARELLPALDNLALALAAAVSGAETEHDRKLVEGIRLVENELSAALARVGIEAYSPEGEPFDPELHEAMAKQPVEGAASGTVAEVYQRGYRQNGVVLRPARVVVAE
ncbi:MAG TPA: nucleotide exchange factor GrpE [Solirubrobacteraceae bacterium]|nr:nucleotide exchange factor GrpE [Solirubrobacteraceae bacterium]